MSVTTPVSTVHFRANAAPLVAGSTLLRASLMTLFRNYIGTPHVVGHEHIPATPFVLCANHRSHLDSLALLCGLSLTDKCALLAARDYFSDGGMPRRMLALPFVVIPVERHRPGVTMLGTIAAAAMFFRDGGQVLIAYPEGTRQAANAIAPFKRGAATLALALGRPLLPVFIDGTERLLPKGRRVPLRGRITLTIGQAIHPGRRPDAGEWRDRSQRLIRTVEASVRDLAARCVA
jgi:1-acyl-sn-glycerol-3-phosphate acyltransferase